MINLMAIQRLCSPSAAASDFDMENLRACCALVREVREVMSKKFAAGRRAFHRMTVFMRISILLIFKQKWTKITELLKIKC